MYLPPSPAGGQGLGRASGNADGGTDSKRVILSVPATATYEYLHTSTKALASARSAGKCEPCDCLAGDGTIRCMQVYGADTVNDQKTRCRSSEKQREIGREGGRWTNMALIGNEFEYARN